MLAPALTAHADMHRHHIAVSVSGPLATEDHADALKAVALAASDRTGGVKLSVAPGTLRIDASTPPGRASQELTLGEAEVRELNLVVAAPVVAEPRRSAPGLLGGPEPSPA